MDVGKAVLADRARRKGEGRRQQLSRKKYGELVGLAEQRVWAIEQGKKLKPGELDQLREFIGDLIEDSGGHLPETVQLSPDQERDGLKAAIAFLHTRLAGKPVPPHLASEIPIDRAAPSEFPRIRAWVQSVHEYLDGVREEAEVLDISEGVDLEAEFDYDAPFPEYDNDEIPILENVDVPESARLTPEEIREIEDASDPIARLRAFREDPEPEPESKPIAPPPEPEFEEGLRYVTNSELRTFKRCRRKWYLDYYRRVRPNRVEVTGAASVGTRVHRVLAEYYSPQRIDPWVTFEKTVEEDLPHVEADQEPRWKSEVDLARAIVEGYLDWVEETAADAGLEITAPETRLIADPKFPGMEHVRLLAKLDVRARRTLDGARLFLDHKTVQDLTTPTRMLHLDEQMLHYHLIEYLDLMVSGNGEVRTDGAIYNMLRKVKRTASAKPPFYGRVEVRHNLDELRNYWLRIMQTVKDSEAVKQALDEGQDHRQVAYPNPTRDCTWQCPHLAVCGMFDDGGHAEEYLADHYVAENPLRRYEQ